MPIRWESSKPIPDWLGRALSTLKGNIQSSPLDEGETPAMRLTELRLIQNNDPETGEKVSNPNLTESEELLEQADFENFRCWRGK